MPGVWKYKLSKIDMNTVCMKLFGDEERISFKRTINSTL